MSFSKPLEVKGDSQSSVSENSAGEFIDAPSLNNQDEKVDLPWEESSSDESKKDESRNLEFSAISTTTTTAVSAEPTSSLTFQAEADTLTELDVNTVNTVDIPHSIPLENNGLEFAVEEMAPNVESAEDLIAVDQSSQVESEIVEVTAEQSPEVLIKENIESIAPEDSVKVEKLPAAKTAESFLLRNNEDWLSLLSHLKLESVLLGIAHSLVFKSFDDGVLLLERPLSVKAFRIDEAEMRLAMAISSVIGRHIACKIEYVEELQDENLHERTERLDEEKFQNTLTSFKSDEVVQYLEQELGAVLLTKTLKARD